MVTPSILLNLVWAIKIKAYCYIFFVDEWIRKYVTLMNFSLNKNVIYYVKENLFVSKDQIIAIFRGQ